MHPRSSPLFLYAIGLIVAVGVGGCSGGGSASAPPPARPVQPAAAKAAAPVPAPAPTPAEYAYQANGRRDPFRALILPKKVEVRAQARGRPRNEREALQVSELKLAGVVWERGGAYALVETLTGKGYVLRVNDRIGEDFGARVAKITPEAVTFEVKAEASGSQAQARQVELRLKKEE